MNEFDILEYGYNTADETINFGTRNLADGNNLYEASTLATLRAKGGTNTTHPLFIQAFIKQGRIYLAVNNSLWVFKDKDCSEVLTHLTFESYINVIGTRDECVFIFIALKNGEISLLNDKDLNTKKLHTICEENNEPEGCSYVVNAFVEESSNILAVTNTGKVYRITTETNITATEVHNFKCWVQSASYNPPFLLVSGCGEELASWIVDENRSKMFRRDLKLKNIFPLNNIFVGQRSTDGNLVQICPYTLLIAPFEHHFNFKNMVFVTDLSGTKQIIAQKVAEETNTCQLQLISYPTMQSIYTINVPREVYIVHPESLADEILYIALFQTDDNDFELRVQKVFETETEKRLQRLLKQQKFDEAEKFAAFFKLDPQIIQICRAQLIVDKTLCDSEDIAELIKLLETIDDDEFKLDCCCNVESSCQDFADVKKVLSYGCKLTFKQNHEDRELLEDKQKMVVQLKYLFETFVSIYQGTDYHIQDWFEFASCNFLDKLSSFLKNFQIEEAKILYSRIDCDSIKKLRPDHILDILDLLNQLPMEIYQSFLPIFIPITIRILPETVPFFIEWVYKKVLLLEMKGQEDFPNNAIAFIQKIMCYLRTNLDSYTHGDIHKAVELSHLFEGLLFLKTLKETYVILLPLKIYLSGPENVTKTLMNVNIFPEDYEIFMKNFVLEYMLENQIDPNKMLLSEIKDMTKYEEKYWLNMVHPILQCFSNTDTKSQAVTHILDSASVPWCESIKKIAYEALSYGNEFAKEIREIIEDEPVRIVMRKRKYEIKERTIRTVEDLTFVASRMIYCNEETMVEDVLQLCKTPQFRHEANMLLIVHFIKIGNIDKVHSILENNTLEEVLQCCKQLGTALEIATECQGKCWNAYQNYPEINNLIFNKLIKNTTNACEKKMLQETQQSVKSSFDLFTYFKIAVSCYELRNQRKKQQIADQISNELCLDLERDKINIEQFFTKCNKLSATLEMDIGQILVNACQNLEDYNFIVEAASRVYETETTSKSLCLMAVLLLKYVGCYKPQNVMNTEDSRDFDSFFVCDDGNVCDNDIFLKGLKLSEMIISKAISCASKDDLSQCLEVANWVNISFYSNLEFGNNFQRNLYGNLNISSTIPGVLTFEVITTCFSLFCKFIRRFDHPNLKYLTFFQTEEFTSGTPDEDLIVEMKNLFGMIENMCNGGQLFTAVRVVSTLKYSLLCYAQQIDSNILKTLQKFIQKQITPKLINMILSKSSIDTDLLYNLLISCDQADSIRQVQNSLKIWKRHPKKLYSIAQTGIRVWNLHGITSSGKPAMTNAMYTVKWWNKFNRKHTFVYDLFFKCDALQRLEMLMDCQDFHASMIQEYCDDFHLDLLSSYSSYLKRTLCNWKPDYEIEIDITKRKTLVVKNNEEELFNKCLKIIEIINNDDHVQNLLDSIWPTINYYYYEVFITMFEILNRYQKLPENDKKLLMLFFLKSYERISSPSEVETEQWFTSFPDKQAVDTLSEFRLPFTQSLFTKSIWDIIRPEVNLKTYKLWFKAIEINEYLHKMDISSYVVKNVASRLASKSNQSEWQLYSKHEDLFKDIDECIQNISDLEIATSSAYYIMTHTPKGIDQVTAAKLAYKYAVRYKESNPECQEVHKAFVKVQKKCYSFEVTHILHRFQLTEEKYLNLVTQPQDLIVNLYQDERIISKNEKFDLQCPDINKAVDAIAAVYGLDVHKIRLNLVNSWLSDGLSGIDLDTSIIPSAANNGVPYSEEANLKRAAYVCSYSATDYWRPYLLKAGALSDEFEDGKCISQKVKALKLLAMITDENEIAKYTEITSAEFKIYVDKLTIVQNLQYLGIALDIQDLDHCNKKELLVRLAQKVDNSLAVKTMAIICMKYKMYNTKYWLFIINNSIKKSLYSDLTMYVDFLRDVHFLNKPFYINAWQTLIDHNIFRLDQANEEILKIELLKQFIVIQTCPVLHSLNFERVFHRCIDLNKPEFSAVLLQYISEERLEKFTQTLVDLTTKISIKDLQALGQEGITGTVYVQTLLSL